MCGEKTSRQLTTYLYIFSFSSFEGSFSKTTKSIWQLSVGCLAMIGLRSPLLLNIGYLEQCSPFRFMKGWIVSLGIPTKCSLICSYQYFLLCISDRSSYIVQLGYHSYDSFISICNINLKLIKRDQSYVNAAGMFPCNFQKTVLTESLN